MINQIDGNASVGSQSECDEQAHTCDDDKEEQQSDESVNYRRRGPSDKRISNTVAREVRRAILKHKEKGQGVMGWSY